MKIFENVIGIDTEKFTENTRIFTGLAIKSLQAHCNFFHNLYNVSLVNKISRI